MLKDQFIKVGSINTCYWSAGSKGPAVLLLHGLGGAKENWKENLECLAKSYQVYALDLPGYGLTDKPSVTYTLPYFTQFLHDFMDRVNVARSSLVGNSLGGVIALDYTIHHPDRIDKLVLVDPACLGTACHPMLRLGTLPILGELSARPGRERSRRVARFVTYNPRLIPEERVEQHYRRSILPGAQEAFLSTARSFIDLRGFRKSVVQPLAEGLPTIAAPTLIIWGKEDRLVPVSQAEAAKERIPNVQLLIFEECGHAPQLEHPDQFNAAVSAFLGR